MIGKELDWKGICWYQLRQYTEGNIQGKMKEGDKDWYPQSNQLVLDVIHPSLHCYHNSIVLVQETATWLKVHWMKILLDILVGEMQIGEMQMFVDIWYYI